MAKSKYSFDGTHENKRMAQLDSNGFEHLDPTPVEIPTRLKIPQRQVERIRAMVRREMSLAAESAGAETFEEADDFDLDDEDWVSPYEYDFEPPLNGDEVIGEPPTKPAPQGAPAKQAGLAEPDVKAES